MPVIRTVSLPVHEYQYGYYKERGLVRSYMPLQTDAGDIYCVTVSVISSEQRAVPLLWGYTDTKPEAQELGDALEDIVLMQFDTLTNQ